MDFSDIQKIAEIDLYEILNVNHTHDYKRIKKNYRKLVLQLHPDKPNGDKEAYELINLAYTILKHTKTRLLYDKERKKHLENSKIFNTLKINSAKAHKNKISKEDAKKEYHNLEEMLNEKHGFNMDNTLPINQSEMMKKLNKLNHNRKLFINNTKLKMKKINVTKSDFNEIFIKDSTVDDNISNEIIAYNISGMQLVNYSGINNFTLYSDNGLNTNNYSSLNCAFNQTLPGNISNNYSDHNKISNFDRKNHKNKLSEYNDLTNNIKNMKITDFNL